MQFQQSLALGPGGMVGLTRITCLLAHGRKRENDDCRSIHRITDRRLDAKNLGNLSHRLRIKSSDYKYRRYTAVVNEILRPFIQPYIKTSRMRRRRTTTAPVTL
jgi:hypothetical protein